jgi:hypothetical protein
VVLAVIFQAVFDFIFGSLLGTRFGRFVVFVGAAAGLLLLLWLAFDAV